MAYRPYWIAWLLLAGAAPGGECRVATSPDGFCIALRLEPHQAELHTGGTLQITIVGLDCSGRVHCVDCTGRLVRVHWRSSAPEVATVDSAGLVRARRPGTADIRLESDESVPRLLAGTRVVVADR